MRKKTNKSYTIQNFCRVKVKILILFSFEKLEQNRNVVKIVSIFLFKRYKSVNYSTETDFTWLSHRALLTTAVL